MCVGPICARNEPTTSIISLPNEILRKIFLHVVFPPDHDQVHHISLKWSDVLPLRSTCRYFRETANHLPFWSSNRWDSVKLRVCRRHGSSETAFLRLLLSVEHLRLCLRLRREWVFTETTTVTELLPSFHPQITSVTPTALSIFSYDPTPAGELLDDSIFQRSLLSPFVNLNALQVDPLTDGICDFLGKTDIGLKEFRTCVRYRSPISETKVKKMFSASSFQTLRCLDFALDIGVGKKFNYSWCEGIVQDFPSIFPDLVNLTVHMTLDVSWAKYISQMASLVEIHWSVPPRGFYDLGKPVFNMDSTLLPNKNQVRAKFNSSFEHLAQKPKINIIMYDMYMCMGA